ncbi:MAG: hypothetical protein IPM95_13810 [Sphingobacteriales bacterium]|nr:hypothetical protein [Sphingobacteriales bacterium]
MKNLILTLAVALSLSACKKEQINELIIGKWKRNGADVTMTFNDDRTVVQESNEPHYLSFSGKL